MGYPHSSTGPAAASDESDDKPTVPMRRAILLNGPSTTKPSTPPTTDVARVARPDDVVIETSSIFQQHLIVGGSGETGEELGGRSRRVVHEMWTTRGAESGSAGFFVEVGADLVEGEGAGGNVPALAGG